MFIKDERDMLNTKLIIPVELGETNDLRLDNPDLDEVKEDTESLDETDNDNDDKKDDKNDDDNKDSDDDDINANNKVDNPRERNLALHGSYLNEVKIRC